MNSWGHYYGDVVRKLFLLGAAIILVSLPFFNAVIPYPISISLLAVIVLALGAGFISWTQRWSMIFDLLVATAALIIFEYYAIVAFGAGQSSFFMTNQLLAIIFLIALYYSVKTVRGTFMDR